MGSVYFSFTYRNTSYHLSTPGNRGETGPKQKAVMLDGFVQGLRQVFIKVCKGKAWGSLHFLKAPHQIISPSSAKQHLIEL